MKVFLNDRFLDAREAMLPIGDLSIQRGYGIFDFFRLQQGVLLYVEDHLARFRKSAEMLRLEVSYSNEELIRILKELSELNGLADAGIRMVLTGGDSPDAWQIGRPAFMVVQQPSVMDPSPSEPKAIRIITHEFVRDIPEAKTINYSMGVWLQQKVKEHGADDVLYYTTAGISEFPRCNAFVVDENGEVFTPGHNILEGITRKRLLEFTDQPIKIRRITLDEVRKASEIFLTSSTKRIQSIVSVDGVQVGDGKPGPVAALLLKKLLASERHYIQSHR